MMLTATVPGEARTLFEVSVVLYWNVIVPLVVPLSVEVARHESDAMVTLSLASDGLPDNEHDATATLSVAGNVAVVVLPTFMLVVRSPQPAAWCRRQERSSP